MLVHEVHSAKDVQQLNCVQKHKNTSSYVTYTAVELCSMNNRVVVLYFKRLAFSVSRGCICAI